jgi:hypothetical protein
MATKQQTEIQSPVVYRVRDKATRQVMYLVQSDSHPNTYYRVQFSNQSLTWQCECPSRKPCKHERAVQEVLKLRRQRIAEAMGPEAVVAVARIQREDDRRQGRAEQQAERLASLPLNGNRPFSLLK